MNFVIKFLPAMFFLTFKIKNRCSGCTTSQFVLQQPIELPHDDDFDPLNVRENLQSIVDDGKLRTKGFNTAVNAFTNFLDHSQLGYQHIENFKNARKAVISEYADKNPKELPDERYSVTLTYLDDEQIRSQRKAYNDMIGELQAEVEKLWNIFHKIGVTNRAKSGELDFAGLSSIYAGGPPPKPSFIEKLLAKVLKKKRKIPKPAEGEDVSAHDENALIKPVASVVDDESATFGEQKRFVRTKLNMLRQKMVESYSYETPAERLVMEDRLEFLSTRFEDFLKRLLAIYSIFFTLTSK